MKRRVGLVLFVVLWSMGFLSAEESGPREISLPDIRQVVAVENVCAWPNLTLLPDGEIIVVFHNQPSHGQQSGDIDCWASRDGLNWEKRSTVTRHEPGTVRMNHAAGLAGNGDLVVLCSGWTNVKQPERPKQKPFRDDILRSWVLRSADGGRTWETRDEFPAADGNWSEHIPFGDIWSSGDGVLHVSTYQGEFTDPAQSTATKGWRSWHFRSRDDGRTWEPVSVISPRHNETDLFPLGDGRWLAAARADAMDLFFSEDNGMSWSETPTRVTERNEINGHLMRLADGRLLLSYGVRIAGRFGVCGKLSEDDGSTWGDPLRLAVADHRDCGYPSSVQLADGTIVTAWYAKESPVHAGYHLGVTVWRAP